VRDFVPRVVGGGVPVLVVFEVTVVVVVLVVLAVVGGVFLVGMATPHIQWQSDRGLDS
jgi:hypothetical protein